MLKSLLEIMKQLLGLSKDTQDNKEANKATQAQLDSVTDTLQRVIFELQRLKENKAHEREKMLLRLENDRLRFERALPPGTANEQSSMAEMQKQIEALQNEVAELKLRFEQLAQR